jgi:hypothetical protein
MIVNVVENFGADLTGGSDSTKAFEAAINVVTGRGGGIVDTPAGVYKIDKPPLRVRTAAHFRGAGRIVRTLPPGTTSTRSGSQTTLVFPAEVRDGFVVEQHPNARAAPFENLALVRKRDTGPARETSSAMTTRWKYAWPRPATWPCSGKHEVPISIAIPSSWPVSGEFKIRKDAGGPSPARRSTAKCSHSPPGMTMNWAQNRFSQITGSGSTKKDNPPILLRNGQPDPKQGRNGDFAWDRSTKSMKQYKKSAGAWTPTGS